MKSISPTNRPAASQRDGEAVAPSSNVGPSDVARPASEKPKGRPMGESAAAARIVTARSMPAKKVRGRPKAKATKNATQVKPAGKRVRKAAPASKQDGVIALLRRPEGASIDALVKSTGWQPHSVRGFLAGTVRKKLKLQLQSQKVDGKRIYRIKAGKTPATTKKSRKV